MPTPAQYLDAPGAVIPPETLTLSRVCALVELLRADRLPFARLVECRKSEGRETVIFDVEAERPQNLAQDIRREERLAATFEPADTAPPEVLALRADFPLVSHINQREQEFPRSLCLYDRPWHEVVLRWTAPAFVEQIRAWLSRTAKGSLHAEDQPLEPFIFASPYHIVIPHEIFEGAEVPDEPLWVVPVGREDGGTLIALRPGQPRPDASPYVANVLRCPPHQHGIVRQVPRTLKQLNRLTREVGLDVVAALRDRFRQWIEADRVLRNARAVLLLLLPKTRFPAGPVEVVEMVCFVTAQTIEDLGVALGVWKIFGGQLGYLTTPDSGKDGDEIPVLPVNPHPSFSWALGAQLNGLPQRDGRHLVAIGAGALGSQVLMNLARAGYGTWTIVDEDVLLPHNVARHSLPGNAVGFAKAEALSATINRLADDDPIATPLVADVLSPRNQAAALDAALGEAEAIVDMAASAGVSRHLAYHSASGRRVSLFLNPAGTDLVLLAEDARRRIALPCLEVQYYRTLWQDSRFREHFTVLGGPLRYGQSCRDLSSRLPQDLVAIHAGVGARALRDALQDDGPTIRIWKIDPSELSIQGVRVPVHPVRIQQHLDWTLVADASVPEKLSALRTAKLPDETGGVLIGAYDMQQKVVYLADVLPSPPDSEEWPTLYIRGCEGLAAQVGEIRQVTGHNLEHVGEWHSHPNGASMAPSDDDLKVFCWLTREMDLEGKPPLMVIAGEGDVAAPYMCRMANRVDEAVGLILRGD
jgi:hypothetical protein